MRRPWHEHRQFTPFEWRWLMDRGTGYGSVDAIRRGYGHATERNALNHDTPTRRSYRARTAL